MMERCETCRYWDKGVEYGMSPKNAWGTCHVIDAQERPGICVVVIADEWEYSLTTHETFGCVFHEPKEQSR